MQPDTRPPATTVPIAPADYAEYPTYGYSSSYPTNPSTGYLTNPAPMYPTAPQPVVPARPPWTGLRLTVIALVVAVGAVVMEALLPPSAVSARTLAYPRPAISITSSANADTHVGDNITFTATVQQGRDLTFSWDFGDGATGSGVSVTHTYSQFQSGGYNVALSAVDPLRQSASAQTNIPLLPALPVACFAITKNPSDPLEISVDATCSTGTGITYAWDFGDQTHAQGVTASHIYQKPNTYVVILTVTDVAQQSAQNSQSVNITVPKPQPCFSATQDPNNPYAVDVDASCSTGYKLTYSWNFGDGGTGSGKKTSYQYGGAQNYSITLTVTDGAQQMATTSQTFTIYGLQASFSVSQNGDCFNFDGSGSQGYGLSYYWDYGDGTGGPGGDQASHCYYSGFGGYVYLTVTNAYGQQSETWQYIYAP